jgi:hypothetical protein
MRKMVILPAALALGLAGCSGDSMTPGGRDVLLGGAGGALAGAAIGGASGAIIGGAATRQSCYGRDEWGRRVVYDC